MVTWTLAKKDLRLLLRDRRAVLILIAMPFLFILVLGMSLGEGFGQKPDDRLRIYFVDLDKGEYQAEAGFPREKWSLIVQRDLGETAGIRLMEIDNLERAEQWVKEGKMSAVLVFRPNFSRDVSRCSFLQEGINPFYRDGIKVRTRTAGQEWTPADDLESLDVELVRDPTQLTAASIIEQVAQVSLLRVVLPWMIGRAFEKIGDKDFIERLGPKVEVPVGFMKVRLDSVLKTDKDKQAVGRAVQNAIQELYPKYNLTGKTWADLTRSEPGPGTGVGATQFTSGSGLLKRGDTRYQILVPSYTVMFAFFLVLTVGWLFVAERRQGTLKRLRAAPLSRTQILFGKLVPCFALSLGQGFFLLAAGKLVFGMNWGTQPAYLVLVVIATSLAAMGLALLVASVARTETQVAIYGTLLVLVLAGISGCLMPRELMPEQMKELSRIAPHAWALDAYTQLLLNPEPNLMLVGQACAVLAAFGAAFVGLAWWFLKLD